MSVTAKNYDIVRSTEELTEFFDRIVEEGKPFGFDIETGYHGEDDDRGSLKQETNLLVGFSFTNSLNWARYVPLAHDFDENITDHLRVAEVLWSAFKTGLLVAHNLGFELRRMARFFRDMLSDHPIYGAEVRESNGYFPAFSDTQVEAYITREFQEFGLKELVLNKFGHKMIKFEELFGDLTEKKKKAFRFNVLDLNSKVVTYACEDALWCLSLHVDQYPKVKDQLVYKIDMEVIYVICDMEDCGIRYDWYFMAEASARAKEFTAKLNEEIQEELAELLGMPGTKLNVNLGSPKQLSEILYDRLGYTVNVYTTSTKGAAKEDKKMSTGKEALAILGEKYPIAAKIATWKNMTRLTGSFLDKYAKDYGNSPDGMIHSSLNQSYVRTARFSSANPNQQNQPSVNIELPDGKKVSYWNKLKNGDEFILNFRDAVIAPDDFYILGFDLSQAEYRAVAGHANETALIEAFENGEDVHKKVASMMFKIPVDKVTKLDRAKAKTLGFGLLYGMTSKALAKKLNVSPEEAEDLFNQYFTAFPRIKRWTEKQIEFGYNNGYVVTKFGRRIPIWELTDSRRWIREGGERACFNYPIQGGATGDYLRIAMVRAMKAIKKQGWKGKVVLFMNVHDALEFYVHRDLNPADVVNVLQQAVIFPVPGWPMLKADWHIGKRWGSVKEIELLEGGAIQIEDGPRLSPGDIYLPTLETEEPIKVDKPEKPVEGLPGTWSHCGNDKPHELHTHDITFQEGTYKDVECQGTPGDAYLPTLGSEEESESKTMIIELDHMPTEEQLGNFKKLVDKVKGGNYIYIDTPEGQLIWWVQSGITPEKHQRFISLALGGATVKWKTEQLDLSNITADLEF